MDKRQFLKAAGLGAAAAAAPAVLARAKTPLRWRMQTYAGPALAAHVARPMVDAFNRIADGEMFIELHTADELAPTAELFEALRQGRVDAVQSDDDSLGSPADVAVFGGYFPFAARHSLDVPALFHQYGLRQIWEEAYGEIDGVTWLGAGAWDPCHLNTTAPVRGLADLEGKRIFTFPTAGRFLSRFGVVPVTLPWAEVAGALRAGELDGLAWSGITESHTVGWADATGYFLTNAISGAWCGSFFAHSDSWHALPERLRELFRVCMDSSHYYRQHWYWGGEARLRAAGGKLELTTIPGAEWRRVEAEALRFWDEVAATGSRPARVVAALKRYRAVMERAGPPYR